MIKNWPTSRILFSALAISVLIWLGAWYRNSYTEKLESRVFKGLCGWGYDILVNDRLLIHQESVPSLSGNCGFARKEWAEQAAARIINKIENGGHPQLTSFDLQQIGDSSQLRYDSTGNTK